jgi:hypothetical protein
MRIVRCSADLKIYRHWIAIEPPSGYGSAGLEPAAALKADSHSAPAPEELFFDRCLAQSPLACELESSFPPCRSSVISHSLAYFA